MLDKINTALLGIHFDKNYLIYRFLSGLGSVYNSYYEQYNQNYNALDDDNKPKFTLDYTKTRFINTIIGPTSSANTSTETQVLAALVNSIFAHTPQSVNTLVATGGAENKIQLGAYAGNSRTYT